MNTIRRRCSVAAMILAIGAAGPAVTFCAAQPAAPAQETFASPEAAVKALRDAVEVHDKAALQSIFGPGIRDLLTGDEAQDKANSRKFAKALAEGAAPVTEKDGTVTLEVGGDKWPFPIPLVRTDSAWRFDTAAGKEEIISRHIGKDELLAIGICRAYVQAQNRRGDDANARPPKTAHGYRFKLVARQGAQNGGYSLTAYPERWGRSGIMTFIVNQDGKLYQRDLGEKTAEKTAATSEYDSNDGWTAVTDPGITGK